MSDIKVIAQAYIDAGWQVVPLVKGEKRANTKWQKTVYTAAHFKPDDGIALKCGEPSKWRVDVDLDCEAAIKAADLLLPDTNLVHGRPGKPRSHRWLHVEGIKTMQFTDVRDSAGKSGMLLELRSTGGYTAAPPSVHPSGDVLGWDIEGDARSMTTDDATAIINAIAIATLLSLHWPGPGVRHQATGHLAGFLCQAGVDPAMVTRIIQVAATIAGDPDVSDRVKFARNTCGKFEAGENVTGGPKLAEALGDDVVAKMRSWLKLADGDAIEEMNERHFWVRMEKDDVVGRLDDDHVVFQKPKALYSEYANRKILVGLDKKGEEQWKPLFQAWLESRDRRSYRKVVFAPPPLVCHEKDFNLWSGFAIEPKDGECPLFLAHLHDIICSGNDAHYQYLLNLLALTCQEPGTPSEVAVALRGDPGAGKGTFVRALGDIFGQRHFAHLDKTADLVGGFNAAISGKIIVFADEAFWAGDRRNLPSLKRLITEPTVRITRKGIDSIEENNCIHLFAATNDTWSWPASFKERRCFALHVSDARVGDFKYFTAIDQELKHGGLAAFLYGMLHRQVDRELIRHVPLTDELRTQQEESMPDEWAWLYDVLDTGQHWPRDDQDRWVATDTFWNSFKLAYPSTHLKKNSFGRRLGDVMATRNLAHRIGGSEPVRAWETRTLLDARTRFDAERGTTSPWGEALPGYRGQGQVRLP